MSGTPWTEQEIQFLRNNWPMKSEQDIATELGRSFWSVQTKRYQLGMRVNPSAWSKEEDTYILDNWNGQTDKMIADALKRTPNEIHTRALSLGLFRKAQPENRRTWTEKEIQYLQNSWGKVSVDGIAKHLNRTRHSVINKKSELGLGAFLDCGDFVSLNQLLVTFTGTSAGYSYKTISWVEKRGMPVHKKRIVEKYVKVVYLDEFWEWAEKNRSFLDFSKMEPLALGEEPDWVAEQRKKDFRAFANQRKDPWTSEEDSRLIMLLKQHKYGYAELSEMLHRSAGAIQRRCTDLSLKERPVKDDNHSKDSMWTDADFRSLADGIRRGDSYTEIGRTVGRSEKAVRGKVYVVYLTENADKIRAMMGDGPWGSGAPVPTVKQALHLSRARTAVKKDLSVLVGVLRFHMNKLGYDPFWQRFMCVNWDDIKGCSAGCTDCDSCASFQRIRPQYCIRCGATFFERSENRICKSCRIARKRQAGRKWYATHKQGAKKEDTDS